MKNSRNAKSLTEENPNRCDLVMAYYAAQPLVYIDAFIDSDGSPQSSAVEMELAQLWNTNPENLCIKKDLFYKLSAEARTVIQIILSSPLETAEAMGLKKKDYSENQARIWKFLRQKCGLTVVTARTTLKELKIYAEALRGT